MEAYCLKCKEKREIVGAVAVFSSNGRPLTSGTCGVCGSKLSKLGATAAHEGLEKPVVTKAAKPKRVKTVKKKAKTSTTKADSNGKKQIKPVSYGKGKELVVVESPAKARTIANFLGDQYKVTASVGHVRDLLKTQLSVDVENNFEPKYRVANEKKEIVAQIKDQAARSKKVYLATDPDREGESIAWHVMESAEIDPGKVSRVVFHEITPDAIKEAFAKSRQIDMDLVDAQQARRILDRLVGFGISPILWSKVKSGLSAGRVQSVALRLVVEREREIQAFVPREYWTVTAIFTPEGSKTEYAAKLVKIDRENLNLTDQALTDKVLQDMRLAHYKIDGIKQSERKVRPSAPFIPSTLQQEASRRLGFLARKTMSVAQQLYEGIDVGNGDPMGLITYMRTDSVHVSKQSVTEARGYIAKVYGKSYLPEKPPVYRTRAASAQEAHEAIRPTSVNTAPDAVRKHLTPDQYKLYRLVWQRFVASQMEAAVIQTTTVDILGNSSKHGYALKTASSITLFPGFRAVYEEAKDEDAVENGEYVDLPLADMKENQAQNLVNLVPAQKFTQPPARYTEASLIQVLEENKIGRPSTYAPILSTIQTRGYVSLEKRRLFPTEIGFLVNDLVVEFFPTIVDISFTSDMEDELDKIADGKMNWVNVIGDFYGPFDHSLDHAKANMPKTKVKPPSAGRPCPQCSKDLVIRNGRYGKFISCSGFPECRYTEPWLEKIGVTCPVCHTGEVIEKRSKKGRVFFGCSRYPECEFTSWNKPLAQACPNCDGLLVMAGADKARCTACNSSYRVEEGKVASPVKN